MRHLPLVSSLFSCVLAAQTAPTPTPTPTAAPAKTWMDVRVGTDLTLACEDRNVAKGGMGSGGAGPRDVRIFCLGADDAGRLQLTILVEQRAKEAFETSLFRVEQALLDQATGELHDAAAASGAPDLVSALSLFPYPPLSAAEWKGKKAAKRPAWVSVAGESARLPLAFTFGTVKDGKKSLPAVIGQLDGKEPVAVQLVGIAGMAAMAQGQMPKLGVSGVEPVPADVRSFRVEYLLDAAKGRVVEVRSTCVVSAADGKLTIDGQSTLRETKRRQCNPAELTELAAVVAELTSVVRGQEPKPERKARAVALQERAGKAGLGPTMERLIDSLTRDGLPPGIGR